MQAKVSLHIDPRMAIYGFTGNGAAEERHPCSSDRFAAFFKEFLARGLDEKVELVPFSKPAQTHELTLFHTRNYIEQVERRCRDGSGMLDAGMTPAERGLNVAAASVVGTVLHAIRRLAGGETKRAFVPIGGFAHAGPEAASDYSIFNDCAVGLRYLRQILPAADIAYIDIDAHPAHSVYEAIREDFAISLVDIYQSDDASGRNLPAKGGPSHNGNTWRIGVPLYSDDEPIMKQWQTVAQWLDRRQPQFLIFVAGVDNITGDPMGKLNWNAGVHRRITRDLCAIADRHAGGRILILGGGGFSLDNVSYGWNEIMEVLIQETERRF